MKTNSTNMIVTALGAAVSGVGYGVMRKAAKGRIGSGILGFGLAHVALGLLDMNRTSLDEEIGRNEEG